MELDLPAWSSTYNAQPLWPRLEFSFICCGEVGLLPPTPHRHGHPLRSPWGNISFCKWPCLPLISRLHPWPKGEMCTCVQQLIGGGRCAPNAALSQIHLAAHFRPPLCICQALHVVLLRLLSHLDYVWGKASLPPPWWQVRMLEKHRIPQLDGKKSLFLFISILFTAWVGWWAKLYKSSFQFPCIGGLWSLHPLYRWSLKFVSTWNLLFFSLWGKTETKQVPFQSPVKIINKNY